MHERPAPSAAVRSSHAVSILSSHGLQLKPPQHAAASRCLTVQVDGLLLSADASRTCATAAPALAPRAHVPMQ